MLEVMLVAQHASLLISLITIWLCWCAAIRHPGDCTDWPHCAVPRFRRQHQAAELKKDRACLLADMALSVVSSCTSFQLGMLHMQRVVYSTPVLGHSKQGKIHMLEQHS
jgi:hypothetical protein